MIRSGHKSKNQCPMGDTNKLQLNVTIAYGLMTTANGTTSLELVCIFHGVLVLPITYLVALMMLQQIDIITSVVILQCS